MTVEILTCPDLGQAKRALASDKSARFFGGGTLLMRAVNEGDQEIGKLVRAQDPAMAEIRVSGADITLGASVTMRDILDRDDLGFLHDTARSVGSPAIRNMATIGGNLFAVSPYGDFATALLALDANVVLADGMRGRTMSLADMLDGRGGADRPIVQAVSFRRPSAGEFRFRKVTRVHPRGAAVVTLAALVPQSGGMVRNSRVAYGGLEERPVRADRVERALDGQRLDENGIARAISVAAEGFQGRTDSLATDWYRLQVLPVHLKRLLLGDD